jgi:hypothetical protein
MKKLSKFKDISKKYIYNGFLVILSISVYFLVECIFPSILFALEQNTDRPGGDYKHFPLASPDPKLCEKECREDPYIRCKAFTYVKPSSSAPNGTCYLKEIIPLPVLKTNCISGLTRQLICVHGNSGQIQDKKAAASSYGWGIDYDVSGKGTWIQYSIPTTEADTIVEGVQLRFTIANPVYGWISAIHVYDADGMIQRFDNQRYGSSLSSEDPKTTNLLLPFEKPKSFTRGIGISILPESKKSGGLAKIVNMEFHSVCVLTTVAP